MQGDGLSHSFGIGWHPGSDCEAARPSCSNPVSQNLIIRGWRSIATSGEFVPVEAEVDDQQGCKREGDDADCGQNVAKMAPVRRHEVQNAAGDEGKGDGVGASHPLAVLDNLAVARGEEGGGGADHPCCGLHGGSWQARTAPGESDPREGADKDGYDVDAAEDAMELDVTLADPRGEIDGADQQ